MPSRRNMMVDTAFSASEKKHLCIRTPHCTGKNNNPSVDTVRETVTQGVLNFFCVKIPAVHHKGNTTPCIAGSGCGTNHIAEVQ